MAALVVVEVRVAAVDDRVARLEVLHQLRDLGLGRVAGRDHDPDGARLLELRDELGDRERRRSRPRPRSPSSSPASGCRRRPRGRRGAGGGPCWRPSDRDRRTRSALRLALLRSVAAAGGPRWCVTVSPAERLAQGGLERGQPALRVGEVDAQDRQVVRLERREVALRPGRRSAGRTCTASPGSGDRGMVRGQLEEPADRRRRPCGAGRSSGGSAARSRRSSRSASRRGGAPGSGRAPRRVAAVGAMNAWSAR